MVQKRSGTPGVSLPHGQVKTILPSATKRPTIQAERLPHGILALIFRYLSLNDLVACMRVCRSWLAYLDNEDSVTWRALCLRSVPESALGDPYLLVDAASWKAKLRAYAHAWNPLDCSRYPNAGIEEEKQLQRERGEMSEWQSETQHSDVQGGSAKPNNDALNRQNDFVYAPAANQVYVQQRERRRHRAKENGVQDNDPDVAAAFPAHYYAMVGEKLRVCLDCDQHLMWFERGSQFLGVAFRHLPPVRLYPAVCAVYGNTEVSMVYTGPPLDG